MCKFRETEFDLDDVVFCEDGEEAIRIVDLDGQSVTLHCKRCDRCLLIADYGIGRVQVALANFYRLRLIENAARPPSDRTMGDHLRQALLADVWPNDAAILEYGIASANHLGLLQHAAKYGATAYDLDRVWGDGRAITALVQAFPKNPYRSVTFFTVPDFYLGTPQSSDDDFSTGTPRRSELDDGSRSGSPPMEKSTAQDK